MALHGLVMFLVWVAVWVAAGAVPLEGPWLGPPVGWQTGIAGGVLFLMIAAIVAGRRRFDELPLAVAVACGGAVGLLLGVAPFAINEPPGQTSLMEVAGVVIGIMTVLGAVSAAGSLLAVRAARSRPSR